jgi:hypothetical protein
MSLEIISNRLWANMYFLLCTAFNGICFIIVFQLTIWYIFYDHYLGHHVFDHSIDLAIWNHSIDSFIMPVETRYQCPRGQKFLEILPKVHCLEMNNESSADLCPMASSYSLQNPFNFYFITGSWWYSVFVDELYFWIFKSQCHVRLDLAPILGFYGDAEMNAPLQSRCTDSASHCFLVTTKCWFLLNPEKSNVCWPTATDSSLCLAFSLLLLFLFMTLTFLFSVVTILYIGLSNMSSSSNAFPSDYVELTWSVPLLVFLNLAMDSFLGSEILEITGPAPLFVSCRVLVALCILFSFDAACVFGSSSMNARFLVKTWLMGPVLRLLLVESGISCYCLDSFPWETRNFVFFLLLLLAM